jgi:hypothetical protein
MKERQMSGPLHLRVPPAACLFFLLASAVSAQSGGTAGEYCIHPPDLVCGGAPTAQRHPLPTARHMNP